MYSEIVQYKQQNTHKQMIIRICCVRGSPEALGEPYVFTILKRTI